MCSTLYLYIRHNSAYNLDRVTSAISGKTRCNWLPQLTMALAINRLNGKLLYVPTMGNAPLYGTTCWDTRDTRDTCLQNKFGNILWVYNCNWNGMTMAAQWVYTQHTMVGHKLPRHTETARRRCSRCAGPAPAARAPTLPLDFRRPTTMKTCGNMEYGE